MNKFAFIILFATFSFVNFQTLAQNQKGEFRLLLGLTVGTDASVDDTGQFGKAGLGLTGGVEYLLSEKFSVAPSFTYYQKKKFEPNSSIHLSVMNIDARYYVGKKNQSYILAGLISSRSKAKSDILDIDLRQNGVNLGFGRNFPFSEKVFGTAEIKYQAVGSRQFAGTLGIGIKL